MAIGPASLYRRFPTKQTLVDEAFADELDACRTIVAEGCADSDPWRGICAVLMHIGELNARNQCFIDAFVSTFPDAVDFTTHRVEILRFLGELARRAKAAGALRDDFVIDDLVLIPMAGRGLTGVDARARVAGARRFSALAIDALRSSGRLS